MNIIRLYDFLQSSKAEEFYQDIAHRNIREINQIKFLKDKYSEDPVAELLTLERLRKNAKERIKDAENYLFTTKGVEQSSSSQVAEYHAKLFKHVNVLADLCCGNGIDLINIAKNKSLVYAVDLSNTALLCSRYNCQINRLDTIIFRNMKAEDFNEEVEAVFIDPDRRPEERRVIQAEDISPNFDELIKIIHQFQNVVIKLSPVFDYLNASVAEPHTWEFISEDGVLKEILLCTGSFATPNINRKVVILPQTVFTQNYQSVQVSSIKKFVYDPDPAIIRSGLVQDLAYEVEASLINKHLSILTSDSKINSEFLKGYEVIEYFHYSVKTLKKYLKENQIGKLVVKVRGFPERPNQVISKFKLSGPNTSLIYLIRMDKEFICLVLTRIK
ncbi:methyltransferase [bacterium]|nr:methyltransferase [bacterium]